MKNIELEKIIKEDLNKLKHHFEGNLLFIDGNTIFIDAGKWTAPLVEYKDNSINNCCCALIYEELRINIHSIFEEVGSNLKELKIKKTKEEGKESLKKLLIDNLFDNHQFKGWSNIYMVTEVLEKQLDNFKILSNEEVPKDVMGTLHNKGSNYYYQYDGYVDDLQKNKFEYLVCEIFLDLFYKDKKIIKFSIYPSSNKRGLKICIPDHIENGIMHYYNNANNITISEEIFLSSFDDIVEIFEEINFSENMTVDEITQITKKSKRRN